MSDMEVPRYQANEAADAAEIGVCNLLQMRLDRRELFKAAGVSTLLGMVGVGEADAILTREEWPHNETQLRIFPGNKPDGPYPEGWIVMPGFGSYHGYTMAADMRRNARLPKDQPLAFFVYSNEDSNSLGSLSDTLVRDYTEPYAVEELSIYGDSMGGPAALIAAAKAGLPLRRVLLNCSPFDISDARGGMLARLVADIPPALYRGEAIGKFATSLIRETLAHHGKHQILRNLERAKHDTFSGASPELLVAQLHILGSIDLNSMVEQFAPIINSNTEVLYCSPTNTDTDPTVYDDQAYGKYVAFFSLFGVKVVRLRVPCVGHANTSPTTEAAHPWILKTNKNVKQHPLLD